MLRRDFLARLAGGAWLLLGGGLLRAAEKGASPQARPTTGKKTPRPAKPPPKPPKPPKLTRSESDALGTTLYFALDQAPFPCPGQPYHDKTVVVFMPRHYRLPRNQRLDLVLHFHGHYNSAANAVREMQLREQLVDSRQNALLVAPQGPLNAQDSGGGKLEKDLGLLKFLTEVRQELQSPAASKALGQQAVPRSARVGRLIISAHSGGYKVTAACLEKGGFDVSEVYLFDALYAESDVFRDWVLARAGQKKLPRHKLVSYYTDNGGTLAQNRALLAELRRRGVRALHEEKEGTLTRDQLTHGAAIFIHTGQQHSGSTWRSNGLRDCLYASCLERHLKSDWFDERKKPRAVDVRE
jgi:hypothetical protein